MNIKSKNKTQSESFKAMASRLVKEQAGQPYWKVLVDEDSDLAEIYLYGVIGQDYWWSEDLDEESLTDLKVVREIKRLEKEYKRINIRINSPGGSVMHGDPMISAIKNSKAEIHTYVDGMAASMAADIWVCGHVRHMSSNSKLMIHSTWTVAVGNSQELREQADMLDKFDEAAQASMSEATGIPIEDLKERFYDHKDHWLTAKDALELGLISRVDSPEDEDEDEESVQALAEKLKGADKVMGTIEVDAGGLVQALENFDKTLEKLNGLREDKGLLVTGDGARTMKGTIEIVETDEEETPLDYITLALLDKQPPELL